jgi:hypothetical protein
VLGPDSAAHLRRLLAFRHFFRHAYATGWDATQLRALGAAAEGLRAPLERDLEALDAFLATVAASLAR